MASKTFKEFLTEFLRCFEVNIRDKKLALDIEDQILDNPQAICTDFKIYKDILFHIVSNAIKFSKQGQKIKILLRHKKFQIDYEEEKEEFKQFTNEQPTNITGYLETKIIDQGIGIDIRKKG